MAREGLRPPVKWAGGKRTLYKRLRPLMPDLIPFYSEAFVGGWNPIPARSGEGAHQ